MLNRIINISLSSNTPKVVLKEISEAHGIKYDETDDSIEYINYIIQKINNNIETINSFTTNICLKKIARYVNSECKWKKGILLKAFNFLQNSLNDKNFDYNDDNYGLQTMENPFSINSTLLYYLLQKNGLKTEYFDTFEDMINLWNCYKNFNRNEIKEYIINNLDNMKNVELLNIYRQIKIINLLGNINNVEIIEIISDKEDEKEDDKEIFLEKENINDDEIQHILLKCAQEYKIDLSMFSFQNILKNYEELLKHDSNIIPSPNRYDLMDNPSLKINFNPNYPEEIYDYEDLYLMCQNEGLPDIVEPYMSLQAVCLTDNFYHGKQINSSVKLDDKSIFPKGNIKNETNTFFETYDELEYDQVLLYGLKSTKVFYFFTYAELIETFSKYKRFTNPITKEIFSDQCINKLFLLTQKPINSNETNQCYKERLELGEEIERIRLYNENIDKDIENFVQTYDKLDEWNKRKIEFIFTSLLNLSMYMRNWDGISDYPLTSESTNFTEDKQIIVDDRVTQGLIEFDKLVKYQTILDLPLIMYIRESNKFVTVTDPNEGLTIGDRIKIVKKGEKDSGGNSCIRLSSNRFCATAYYYMILIGMRLPFAINQVTYIS